MIYSDFLDEDELKAYAQAINNRAKSAGKTGRIDADNLRDRVYASGGRCDWCATSLVRQPFEVDHIISLSQGGSNTPANLAVACPDCNRAKSAKHPARFAQETYARTGILTPLLKRVFDYYGVEATVQKSFFDTEETTPPESPDEPPPYIWGQ